MKYNEKVISLLLSSSVTNFELGVVLMGNLDDEELIDTLLYLPTKALLLKPTEYKPYRIAVQFNRDYVINERCFVPESNFYNIELEIPNYHTVSVRGETVTIKAFNLVTTSEKTFTKSNSQGISDFFRKFI